MEQAEKLALAELCTELEGLREESQHQPQGIRDLLVRIEEAARAREPFLDLLAKVFDSADVARGLSTGLPGGGVGHADEEWFGCPDGACDRRSLAVPAGPVPRCLVLGRAMRRR